MGNEIEKKLREIVRETLIKKNIEYFIGYGGASDLLHTTPCFIKNSADIDKLVWTPFCNYNLVKYLLEAKELQEKTGIVVKGCDARAFIELLKHNQIQREKIFILGVGCKGQVDQKKIRQIVAEDIQIEGIEDLGDTIILKLKVKSEKLKKEEVLRDKCFTCRHPVDFKYDIILGEMVPLKLKVKSEKLKKGEVDELESLSIKERREYWNSQFSQCIRCYACRNICYACFCPECIFDKSAPRWISKSNRLAENWIYHLTRAFHIAGRCIDCGECERVCPVGIPLRKLNKRLDKDLKELFGYEGAGIQVDKKPPMIWFDLNDPDPFI